MSDIWNRAEYALDDGEYDMDSQWRSPSQDGRKLILEALCLGAKLEEKVEELEERLTSRRYVPGPEDD